MPSPGKQKGNTGERELVKILEGRGFSAKRAWGSDGRALGEKEGVDVVADHDLTGLNIRVQVKRLKRWSKTLHPPDGSDMVAIRGDREEWHVVLKLDEFLQLMGI